MTTAKTLSQYMTPAWAAERLLEIYFPHLCAQDLVVEPTCGTGAFLAAIPTHVPAFGIELDPLLAQQARDASGREVICADIRSVRMDRQPTAVIGNPPFRARLVREILNMAHAWLPNDGLCGFILPAYLFQSARPTVALSRQWRIQADHIPRDLFPSLTKPLVFATFRKGGRTLVGFSLYEEFVDVAGLAARLKDAVIAPSPQPWRVLVTNVLHELGGEADLTSIYAAVEPKRPTGNPWWREKVRQVAQYHCRRVSPGRYALPVAA